MVERDAGGAAEAVAERVSALAVGDVLRQEGRDRGAERLLGDVLEGEAAGPAVFALDRGDEGICRAGEAHLKKGRGSLTDDSRRGETRWANGQS